MANEKQAAKADTQNVQAQVDQIEKQGFVGQKIDPTPNENYTASGVAAGKPTPETDDKAAAAAAEALRSA
jgi:hypothetical protein